MTCNAPVLFALESTQVFGEKVAHRLSLGLSPHEARLFEDGEHAERALVNVRGRNVFVLQSLYSDQAHTVDDKLCRLLFFIGALKDAGASRVTAVVPYLAYARKDQKNAPRDPVTTRYLATLFEAVGTDAVVTLDVHNLSAFQNAYRCATEHLEARSLFVAHFAALLADCGGTDRQAAHSSVTVVSPDTGGVKRADKFRQSLEKALDKPVSMAFAEKYRSSTGLAGNRIVGEVGGKVVVIFDDLISSGATLDRTARRCHESGATRILGAATHGLFTGNAPRMLADSPLERIVVTDSVPPFRLTPGRASEKVDVVSCVDLFAEAIKRLHDGGSIAALLDA
jgi:ribose-phosphate pyrophosphokinase